MGILRRMVYRVCGPNIGNQVRRVILFAKSGKKKVNSSVNLSVLGDGYHTSCGYYDFDPVMEGMLAYLTLDRAATKATVWKKDLKTGQKERIENGQIANWQQGNRVRWKDRGTIIFNSIEDGRYVAVESRNGSRRVHPYPVYDVKNNLAVSLDFTRLGWMRPGYGYTLFPMDEITEQSMAVAVYNMDTDQAEQIITYADMLSALGRKVRLENCYINHLCFSPSGDKFLFFFIEIQGNRHMCYLAVCQGGKVEILDRELSASHYTWKNDNVILATSYDEKRNCGYYLYDLVQKNRTQVMPQLLNKDGHPTYINESLVVTDTYPDKEGFQHILLVDCQKETVKDCVAIYSTAKHMGVERCDLHPRFAKETNEVYFDADVDGHRRLYSFRIEEALKS